MDGDWDEVGGLIVFFPRAFNASMSIKHTGKGAELTKEKSRERIIN